MYCNRLELRPYVLDPALIVISLYSNNVSIFTQVQSHQDAINLAESISSEDYIVCWNNTAIRPYHQCQKAGDFAAV